MIAANIVPRHAAADQPACLTDAVDRLIDCGNWGVSASWTVPSTAVSGVYIAHLVRNDTGGDESQIPSSSATTRATPTSSCRPPTRPGRPTTTTAATACTSCTVSCPPGNPLAYKAAYAVSYNRPFDGILRHRRRPLLLLYAEYQMIRFLEENGYDIELRRPGRPRPEPGAAEEPQGLHLQRPRRVLVGRRAQRTSRPPATRASTSPSSAATRCSGRPAGRTRASTAPTRPTARWSPTRRPTSTRPTDPQDPGTGRARGVDPRFSPPADGGRPPNALTGQSFLVNSGTADIKVPAAFAKLRFWRNTAGRGTHRHADADARARAPGRWATSGTPTRTTASGQPVSSTCPRPRSAGSRSSLDYGSTTEDWYRDPSPHALPRAERGAGLRRRDRAVVLGPRQHERVGRVGHQPQRQPA